MNVHGYELVADWKNSSCGQTVKAKKGVKSYFIKKYQTPVEPVMNGALDERTFDNNKRKFEKYVAYRRRINTTLRPLAGEGGNLVIPEEEFVLDHHYMEVSPLVGGVVPDEELEGVLMSLSPDVKKLLMLTAAGALSSIHGKGIIHSDLKLKNVLLAVNSSGNYVAKIIDFDAAYFMDDKPVDEIIGDINYYSPELGRFSDAEDEREALLPTLTEKSDIFSLGLIFHFYLAGHLPAPKSLNARLQKRKDKGKAIYCWSVLLNDCELEIDPSITNVNYVSLIRDMLDIDPDRRPTAVQVLQRLKSPSVSGGAPVIEEPWPDHRLMLDKDKIKADGIVIFKKVTSGGNKLYEITDRSGVRSQITADDVVSRGYARSAREEIFCEPWAEHSITFDQTRMRSRGFVSAEQTVKDGAKGYTLYRADSSSMFFKLEMLIAMKYAIRGSSASSTSSSSTSGSSSGSTSSSTGSSSGSTSSSSGGSVAPGICEPWAEHGIAFVESAVNARGYVRVEQATLGGAKGYNFIRPDGTAQFIKREMVLMFKMATKL